MTRQEAVEAVSNGLRLISDPTPEQSRTLIQAYDGLAFLATNEGPETAKQARKLIDIVEQDAIRLTDRPGLIGG